jgi:Uma2 family endonuclease
MASKPKQRFTPEEYLAMERAALYKSEYLDGEIFAMAGASEQHILIEANIIGQLNNQLSGRPCRVYTSNMKIDLSKHGLYGYPDAVVVCGETLFSDKYKDNLINPVVIVEVLSASTEAYDRGENFIRYRKLKTFKEYLLIAQDTPHVEHYVRQPNHRWTLSEADGLRGSIYLPAIKCTLKLSKLYDKVKFAERS